MSRWAKIGGQFLTRDEARWITNVEKVPDDPTWRPPTHAQKRIALID